MLKRRTIALFLAPCLSWTYLPSGVDAAVSGTPQLNSLPGADYTLYLDLGGFTFDGTWGGRTPGATPAFANQTVAFTAAQQTNITRVWAVAAQKFVGLDVNVTTVDPAVAGLAGQGLAYTDGNRQAFYGGLSHFEHTVVGGTGDWYNNADPQNPSSAAGVSYLGGANFGGSQGNTNWVFSAKFTTLKGISEVISHEDGHALGLSHQSDVYPNTPTTIEYSKNNDASGPGSFSPIMGRFNGQRGTFRNGTKLDDSAPGGFSLQNDVAVINNLPDMRAVDDGVSHDLSRPTPIVLSGSSIGPRGASGYLKPVDFLNPDPMGVDSYTKDYFSFGSNGGPLTIKLTAGSSFFAANANDYGETFEGLLKIFNLDGTLVATTVLSADTYSATFSGTLAAGAYVAEVSDIGGYQSTYDATAQYYTMGAYFLNGSGLTAVPEPASLAAFAIALTVVRRRRRARA